MPRGGGTPHEVLPSPLKSTFSLLLKLRFIYMDDTWHPCINPFFSLMISFNPTYAFNYLSILFILDYYEHLVMHQKV